MEDHVSKFKVEEDLECTICLDPSVSPIHSCTNGHIVCGNCCEKVKNCGICGEDGLFKCGLAERLAQKYVMKIPCKNFQFGCEILIKSTEMKAHLPLCEYRPIRCIETNPNDCTTEIASFEITEFVDHLLDHHEIEKLEADKKDGDNEFLSYLNVKNRSKASQCYLSVCESKGQYFLLNEVFDRTACCLWITVLGGQTQADKYYYTAHLTSPSKNIEVTWKFPVLPYHKGDTFEKVVESGQYVRMDNQILSLMQENQIAENEPPWVVYRFKIHSKSVDSN